MTSDAGEILDRVTGDNPTLRAIIEKERWLARAAAMVPGWYWIFENGSEPAVVYVYRDTLGRLRVEDTRGGFDEDDYGLPADCSVMKDVRLVDYCCSARFIGPLEVPQ